jgi:hypothetical protein
MDNIVLRKGTDLPCWSEKTRLYDCIIDIMTIPTLSSKDASEKTLMGNEGGKDKHRRGGMLSPMNDTLTMTR